MLPDRRNDVTATDADRRRVRLTRVISHSLYRCPGCHGEIAIGDEHVLVQVDPPKDGYTHHHWHSRCAGELLIPELRGAKSVPAGR